MTSRHASGGGRRGVASWIIVTAVAVVLVVAATVGYLLIIKDNDDSAQGTCTSQVLLPMVASPGAATAITEAAAAFDATAPVARSACVTTTVTTVAGTQAQQALAAGWTQQSSPAPGVWVPDTGADLAALESADSALTAGRDPTPVATSPVVLAVRTDDAAAVTAAGLSWSGLAAATGQDGAVALPAGRHLVLALPDPSTNRASSYALQSVLAARTGGTVDAGAVSAAATDLATIGAGGPQRQPGTTTEALTQLAGGTDGFTAVPVVASDLAAFSRGTPGLTAISPAGGTVGDAVYPVPLTASWVTPTLKDASALFMAYLRGAGGDTAFTDNGLVAAGGAGQAQQLPDAGQHVADAIATAIGASPAG
jgi:hypothetical protein